MGSSCKYSVGSSGKFFGGSSSFSVGSFVDFVIFSRRFSVGDFVILRWVRFCLFDIFRWLILSFCGEFVFCLFANFRCFFVVFMGSSGKFFGGFSSSFSSSSFFG